jgi:non-ribosomal peptide synthetase component F
MLTVYVAVLWRWCRQKDFVVPVKIAGRQSEHKAIVGYFTHIVYLRLELTGEETWTELLSRVSSEFFKALAHEDCGQMALERPELLTGSFFQWITRRHELSGVPEATEANTSGLTVQHVSSREVGDGLTAIPPGMVDVELTCFDAPEGLYASGVYRADRFTPITMERFMEELRSTAEEFVRSPGVGIERVARQTTAA